MTAPLLLIVLAAISCSSCCACGYAESEKPIFNGVMSVGGRTYVLLAQPTEGPSATWIRVGGEFRGHQIVAYDDATESLLLRSKQTPLIIHLKKRAKIVSETPPLRAFRAGDTLTKIAADLGVLASRSPQHMQSSENPISPNRPDDRAHPR